MDSSPHFSKVGNFEIRSGGYGNVLEIPILAEQMKINPVERDNMET